MKPEGVPSEIFRVLAPPEELQRRIQAGEQLCGGRFTMVWTTGPLRGKTTTTYCATPGCLTTGYCTGPRFVPHPQQSEPDGTQRRVTPGEVVPAARKSAMMALGKNDPRSDREIRAYVAMIYSRMKKAYQGRW